MFNKIYHTISAYDIKPLLAAVMLVSSVSAQAAKQMGTSDNLFFFEEQVLPTGFQTPSGSKLSLSTQRYKDGQQSLRWDYKTGRVLVINQAVGFQPSDVSTKDRSHHAFMGWVYNEVPVNDQLTFDFWRDDKVQVSFKAGLNFKGWRALAVPFETDMKGWPVTLMERVTITAPSSVQQGTIYFDQIALSLPVDPRWPTPDYQQPFVNLKSNTSPNAHWTALLQYDHWLKQYASQPATQASATELAALDRIERRIDEDLLKGGVGSIKKSIQSLSKRYQSYLFVDRGGQSRLRPVIMVRELETFQKAEIPKKQIHLLDESSIRLQSLGRFMLRLAQTYRLTNDKVAKKYLHRMFAEVVVHLYDQGFARGSGRGIMHHQGYSIREWARSLFLMRDIFGGNTSLAQEQLAWFVGLGRMLRPEDQIVGFNVDVMNTMLQGMLFGILMEPDNNLKAAYLRQLSHWMSVSVMVVKGLAGGIQADGSFFHHSQHYVAYGNGGLRGLTSVVYYLSRTPYQLSAPAHAKLKHSVMMTRIFSNDLKLPMSLSGRHPDGELTIALVPFKYLAMAGEPGAQAGYDLDLARAYQRLVKSKKRDNFSQLLSSQGINAEEGPNGSWVMNYSSLALHRRDDWLVSARGFSRYLVGNETYARANHFGRYLNYGHLEILPADSRKRGFKEEGWDWNRWPGTTSIHLPLEELSAVNISQVSRYASVDEMLLSDQTFSGGNQLVNSGAMFAMKLQGHPKYDGSFTARKSVYFFGDIIVALGSGISTNDSRYNTETILFQDALESPLENIIFNGEVLSGLAMQIVVDIEQPVFLLDTQDNAYYLPVGQSLVIERKQQHSIVNEGNRKTVGNFATAVISHGKQPQNRGYEYAIKVAAGRAGARAFAGNMGELKQAAYTVLQRDNNAHIVKDRASNTLSYALFEPSQDIAHGLLKSVDTAVMVMLKQKNDVLEMALTDPDLNLYQGIDQSQYNDAGIMREVSIYSRAWRYSVPQKKTTRLTLAGQWKAAKDDRYRVIKTIKGNTIIEVDTIAAQPVQMRFARMQ